jgi:hypothetical protein
VDLKDTPMPKKPLKGQTADKQMQEKKKKE